MTDGDGPLSDVPVESFASSVREWRYLADGFAAGWVAHPALDNLAGE